MEGILEMTELDYLKLKLADKDKAFDKLFDRHMVLLKQQGELEEEIRNLQKENSELKLKSNKYKILSEVRKKEIHNRILSIRDYINDCEDENVKQELKGLFHSEVKEYDLSNELRELKKENEQLKEKIRVLSEKYHTLTQCNARKLDEISMQYEQIKGLKQDKETLMNYIWKTTDLDGEDIKEMLENAYYESLWWEEYI